MIKHINITVSGRVQGVAFRYSTLNTAKYYDIKGFVKNKVNGSVYIEAEGNKEKLDLFVEWCKKGPDMARVDDILITESGIINFKLFEIR
ncbi:MAG: acylphosphatase [Bacteroidales bacterium]|nr:acylphosphatase [Bacteroidales bacterium]